MLTNHQKEMNRKAFIKGAAALLAGFSCHPKVWKQSPWIGEDFLGKAIPPIPKATPNPVINTAKKLNHFVSHPLSSR
jgi:hypothetical protein